MLHNKISGFLSKKVKCTLQVKNVEETLFLIVDNGEGLSIAGFNGGCLILCITSFPKTLDWAI